MRYMEKNLNPGIKGIAKMRASVFLCLLLAAAVSLAKTVEEGKTEANSPPCSNCAQNDVVKSCRDILDDPNSPTPAELGEAPTGY